MERIRRRFLALAPLLLVTLFGLPLVIPLLQWTAVPCSHDGHLHYHRIAAMRHAWENGIYFTRWLPDLAFGYGYPFFVYREPAPLYSGLFLHLLGLPLPAASNLLYVASILAAGWFTYLWVRDIMGSRAGLVAAVAYMAAPYVLIDALIRGNLPESLALALFPFLLWAGRRWLLGGTAASFLAGALGLALLALSHNISLLLFTPALFLYLVVIGWLHRLEWRVATLRLALLFGLGLGMTVFYAGGALLEMDQVTLEQSTTTRNNDFRFNFASLEEILAPVAPEDPTLVNPPLPFRLGWVPVFLAVLGLFSVLEIGDWRLGIGPFDFAQGKDWRLEIKAAAHHAPFLGPRRQTPLTERRWHVGLMAAATAACLFMSLPLSRPLWEALPLIDFVQFPWRFVGRAALPVAFLAGAPFASGGMVDWSGRRLVDWSSNKLRNTFYVLRFTFYGSRFAVLIALALLVVEALPNLYPSICAEDPFPTIVNVHNYERETGLVGVDPEGSYFPRTVRERPRQSALEANYQANQMPQRFDTAALPEGAVIHAADYYPLGATIHLNSPKPFVGRYLSFDFPGWTAWVDGEQIPITPGEPDGLVTFAVPAGEHVLTVRWQSTSLRAFLLGLSLLALVGAVVTAVVLRSGKLQVASSKLQVASSKLQVASSKLQVSSNKLQVTGGRLQPATCYLLLVTGLVLLAFKLFVVDRMETPLRRAAPAPVDRSVTLQAGELRLIGYDLAQNAVAAGDTFDIDMAWTAVAPPAADYQSNVWLVGPDGLVWSDKNTERPRLYEDAPRTRFWEMGQWGWDSREVQVLSGTPPGQYDIVLTLFDLATLQPLTLVDSSSGVAVGPTAVIGQINVAAPARPATFNPQFPRREVVPGTGLRLLGFNQDRAEAIPGETVLLTLFWERMANPVKPFVTVQLLDETDDVKQEWELPLTPTDFSLEEWQRGHRLRSQYLLRLPASLDNGIHDFRLGSSIPLGEIAIRAPERVFVPPDVETVLHATFADFSGNPQITLIGYTLSRVADGTSTDGVSASLESLTLVWQAEAELTTSYHVFIHLVDGTGQIVAQTDSEPAGWTRPTTSWAPGEYIVDDHQFSLPENVADSELSLRVGLYDPDTGERLQVEAGEFVTLPLFVEPN